MNTGIFTNALYTVTRHLSRGAWSGIEGLTQHTVSATANDFIFIFFPELIYLKMI